MRKVFQAGDQKKIPVLLTAVLLLMLVLSILLGAAVANRLTRWHADYQAAYAHTLAVSNAGQEAHAMLSRLHVRMLGSVVANDTKGIEQQEAELRTLGVSLRNSLALMQQESQADTERIAGIERLLQEWQGTHLQMLSLLAQGQRDKALKLAMASAAQSYIRLDADMNEVLISARHRAAQLAEEARAKSEEVIRFLWWCQGALVASGIILGGVAIRKTGRMLELNRHTTARLHESEERMKLALSGADEGTWDLDIATGKLNFDSQWGGILDYTTEQERPHCIKDWAELIHGEDRERVLKAMHDHVDGAAAEYKAEYRIRSRSGALKWVAGHGRAVSRDAGGKALRIVGVTRDITGKKQAEDTIWRLAHTDHLTGLPNRTLLYDRLQQCIAHASRHNKQMALLFMDLDDFKQVNDGFGHDVGDILLRQVAERLRGIVRAEDTVARTGGDEFIFVLNDIPGAEGVAKVADKIVRALAEPFEIREHSCRIGSSIGISLFPGDSDTPESLITQADAAMYKAKFQGKNSYQFFAAPQT